MNPGRFLPPRTYVRRSKDGMLGETGATHSLAHSGYTEHYQDITWLGEWTFGSWTPGARHSPPIEILEGTAASAAAARFAALRCATCAGTGRRDPRYGASDSNRCPNERCVLGRLLGVEPAFDASYEDYKRYQRRSAEPVTGPVSRRRAAPRPGRLPS